MKNKLWKYLFMLLLALNIAFIGVIGFQVTKSRDQKVLDNIAVIEGTHKVAAITTDTEQLNSLINNYLETFQTKDMSYKFYLSQKAVFEGSYKFFGTEIPLYVYLEPYALKNGTVELKVTSFSIGTLNLPISEVLKFVSNKIDLPDFVAVHAEEEEIVVNLTQLEIAKNTYVQADKIDLKNGQFTFNLMQK
ncbi:hypothetical protein Hs30E_02920 [Lactococcus hodotermopsidis]|uniref:DUF2140 domain-containing protein n=1 Tax=Pseudolactococcus hodotermopsidis TaxID=2709157 RepID=A0A6A0BBA7_9LACT|nr:YpmS family protein [Lactococcus hodotermopsidis]GFH41741.1 hypothetical protein Hs30E_02920 [Lactococcus hodotermopsidis]